MNDFTVKPIEEFPAYYKGAGNVIYGVPQDSVGSDSMHPVYPEIVVDGESQRRIPDEFFVINSVVYMRMSLSFLPEVEGEESQTVVKFVSQTGGEIAYLDEADFPAEPERERLVYDDGTLEVSISEYEDGPISVLSRNYNEPMVFVDAVMRMETGYLVSVVEGRGSARPAGILFWKDDERRMTKWKEPGRFWVR